MFVMSHNIRREWGKLDSSRQAIYLSAKRYGLSVLDRAVCQNSPTHRSLTWIAGWSFICLYRKLVAFIVIVYEVHCAVRRGLSRALSIGHIC